VDTDQPEVSSADQQQLERYKSKVEKLRLEIAEKDGSLRNVRTKIEELQAKLHTAGELQGQYKQKITEVSVSGHVLLFS
jgi:chromosome segregation ATPase